jgi:nucleoside-diphosphate-sugar epimerase
VRVAITGATGNVGAAVIQALAAEPAVDSIVGIARRRPDVEAPKTTWATADISRDRLEPVLEGSDAVIHLAWKIQPSYDREELWRTNVLGSRRVFEAAHAVGVQRLVAASSIGVYSPAPKDRAVDERWPRNGIGTSFYSRHKAEMERQLDRLEQQPNAPRVLRLRPALIFWGPGADRARRLFAGPLVATTVLRPSLIRRLPLPRGLVVQCVHAQDVAEAYRLCLLVDTYGAFNIAAQPALGPNELGRAFGAPPLELPPGAVRTAVRISHRLHLQPTPEGWVDMGLNVPVMSTARARAELRWEPRHDAYETISELLDGLRHHRGGPTPPLDRAEESGPFRLRELANLANSAPVVERLQRALSQRLGNRPSA